jgi:hypothetical protein
MRIPGRDVPYVPVISLRWYNDRIEVTFVRRGRSDMYHVTLFAPQTICSSFSHSMYSKNRAFIYSNCHPGYKVELVRTEQGAEEVLSATVVIGVLGVFVIIYRMSNGILRVRKVATASALGAHAAYATVPASICPIQRNLSKPARYLSKILPSFFPSSFRCITSVFSSIPYPP